MNAKIPTTIITGFLGAGKTTIIHQLMRNNDGLRIALIINEFGDLGIDGDILQGCNVENCTEDDIVELSNGCICCTVANDFIPAMTRLLERALPPEHIIIETSGLALPQPLVQAFNWPEIRTRVSVDSVIALVDGPAWQSGQFTQFPNALQRQRESDDALDHETSLSEVFDDQMNAADVVVITKTDMLADGGEDIKQKLAQKTRPNTTILCVSYGKINPKILIGLGLATETVIKDRPAFHHHAHDDDHQDDNHHDAFKTFTIELDEIDNIDDFIEKISHIAHDFGILRIKGFGAVRTKPMRAVIQNVGARTEYYYDMPFGDNKRMTRLVIIGRSNMDERAITRALSA